MTRLFKLFRIPVLAAAFLLPVSGHGAASLSPFQELVDQTPQGGTLVPEQGTYAGPVVIDKSMEIDGRNGVTIDNGGSGTVVKILTDGVTLRNLRLVNSGESHNDIDAGVQVRGNFNVVKDNIIEDCLFGIDLQESESNIIRRNTISSKDVGLGIRGDAIRLWYSFKNKITRNTITNSRDMVVWYSKDNLIAGNTSSGGRYSLHFMYSKFNRVEDNHFSRNTVGIFLMYSDNVEVRNNHVSHSIGITGMGLGMKESSGLVIEGNEFLYSAAGIYSDVSPYQPDTLNVINDNTIAYNVIGVHFHNDWTGSIFRENRFFNNISQVIVEGNGTANRNEWSGNYWDDYRGFDRNFDDTGDTPYELYAYADRLWMDVPAARFFKGAPILEVIDFLERLAPFTEPQLVVRDRQPRLTLDAALPDKAVSAAQGLLTQ